MREPLPWSRESFRIKLRTIYELMIVPGNLERPELFDLQALTEHLFNLPRATWTAFLEQFDRAADEIDSSHLADVILQASRLPEPDRTASLQRLAGCDGSQEQEPPGGPDSLGQIRRKVQQLPSDLQEEWAERVLEMAGQRQRTPRAVLRTILHLPRRYRSRLIQASFAILDKVLTDDTQEPAE